jgi:biotin synthase
MITASSTGRPEGAVEQGDIRHNWSREEVEALFALPFNDLLFQAQTIHRRYFDPNQVQVSTLLSIKTGACPEDCAYCPQSTRYDTGLEAEKLMAVEKVLEQARAARTSGATRFCMGAAWRCPKPRDMPHVVAMVKGVRELGLESCMTLGMLTRDQADELQDRLETLDHVRNAGMKICSGGIVGMGEQQTDRAGLLQQLANLPQHPESVPINMLVRVEGTPLEDQEDLDPFEFIRTIAVARIMMPASHVRLSAGREEMNEQMHALAYFAGANSIFPRANADMALFSRLGIEPEQRQLERVPEDPSPRFYDAAATAG